MSNHPQHTAATLRRVRELLWDEFEAAVQYQQINGQHSPVRDANLLAMMMRDVAALEAGSDDRARALFEACEAYRAQPTAKIEATTAAANAPSARRPKPKQHSR